MRPIGPLWPRKVAFPVSGQNHVRELIEEKVELDQVGHSCEQGETCEQILRFSSVMPDRSGGKVTLVRGLPAK